jgi:serine/threonine protein kinase
MLGSKLHIATRYLAPGSLLDIIKYAYPGGFNEIVVATVLKQVLDGLVYLVKNGWIHRDIKAANLLCDGSLNFTRSWLDCSAETD